MLSVFSLVTVAISAFAMMEGATAGTLRANFNSAIYKRQPDWFASSNEVTGKSFEKRMMRQQTQQKQQVPPSLLNIIIKRLSADLANTIAKYSKLAEAGIKMPTSGELTAALRSAMKQREDDPVAREQATQAAIDGLAESKLSGSNSTSKLNARQEISVSGSEGEAPKFEDSDVRRFANRFLKMVKAFADAKMAGGSLPTAEEIERLLHRLQQTLDQSDQRKRARATHQAFMELAASKFPPGKKPTFDTSETSSDSDSEESDASSTKSADSDPTATKNSKETQTTTKNPKETQTTTEKPKTQTTTEKPETQTSTEKPDSDANTTTDSAGNQNTSQ